MSVFARHLQLVALALTITFGLAFRVDGAQAGSAQRPNVLLIMTDQHYAEVLGCAGDKMVKTPHLDQLAGEGARITRATCATPLCSPARVSIRTGQYPHTNGIFYNVPIHHAPPERKAKLPGMSDKHIVLDNLLFDHGYKVRHFGKWHMGNMKDLHCYKNQPAHHEERTAYGKWRKQLGESVIDHKARAGEVFVDNVFMPEDMARAHRIWKAEPYRTPQDLSRIGRSPVAAEAQLESWLTDQVIQWLEKNGQESFMLTYSADPPHAEWMAPDPYYSMYDPAKMVLSASFWDRPIQWQAWQPSRLGLVMGEAGLREYLRCYYAQVTMMDYQIGRILNKLGELGLEQNTLVIYTSDHGDMQASHGMVGKAVTAFYDEILRIPLMVRYPKSIAASQVVDMHASTVDIMPTILDYVGIPIPKTVQGRSLRPVLDGQAKPDDRPAFSERGGNGPRTARMIRTKEWKYTVHRDGLRELFHLAKDPAEVKNLADKPAHKKQRQELEQQLKDWMKSTNDPALATLFASGSK